MPPAQQDEVVERCRPAVRPVLHVVRVGAPRLAAGKAAVPVPRRQRPAQRRRDGPGPAANIEHLAGWAVVHRDGRGVARQTPGRLRGDVDAASLVEHRLAAGGAWTRGLPARRRPRGRLQGPRSRRRWPRSRRRRPVRAACRGTGGFIHGSGRRRRAPPRRSCGNVRPGRHAPLDPGRVGVNSAPVGRDGAVACSIVVWNALVRPAVVHPATLGQRVGVHMHDHLIAVARRALVQPAGQCALGHHAQCIRPPLRDGGNHRVRRVPGRADRPRRPRVPVAARCRPAGVRGRRVEGRLQRPPHHGAHLRRQPPADHDHAVVVHPGIERPRLVPLLLLGLLGRAVHPPPRADHLFDVRRGAGQSHVEQRLLGLGRGHAGDGAQLRVGDGAAPQRVAQLRQLGQGARHAHVLAGGAGRETDAPAQPGRARGEVIPAAACVELADQDQQLPGGGLDAGGQLGDAVAESLVVGRRRVRLRGLAGRGRRRENRGRRRSGPDRGGARVKSHASIIIPTFSTACTAPGGRSGRGTASFPSRAGGVPPAANPDRRRDKSAAGPTADRAGSKKAVKRKTHAERKKQLLDVWPRCRHQRRTCGLHSQMVRDRKTSSTMSSRPFRSGTSCRIPGRGPSR